MAKTLLRILEAWSSQCMGFLPTHSTNSEDPFIEKAGILEEVLLYVSKHGSLVQSLEGPLRDSSSLMLGQLCCPISN